MTADEKRRGGEVEVGEGKTLQADLKRGKFTSVNKLGVAGRCVGEEGATQLDT